MRRSKVTLLASLALASTTGCIGVIGGDDGDVGSNVSELVPATPAMARLTQAELANSWRALLGTPLDIPTDLPSDDQLYGFTSISAAATTISPIDVEQYETATYAVIGQVWGDTQRRGLLVGCVPASMSDPCVAKFFERFGKRAWRRPLTTDEVQSLVVLGDGIAKDIGDVWEGLRFSVAAMLESPNFLFRVDVGAMST